MKNLSIFFVALIAFASLSGCKSENPTPELKDPIYQDLKKLRESLEKELETQKKTLLDNEKKLEGVEPRTRERVVIQRDIQRSKITIDRLAQEAEYIKIREERRRVESRRSYKLAFQAGKDDEWPDKKEFELYKKMKQLRGSSRNWDSRVPRLSDRIPKPLDAKAQKPAEAPPAE